MKEIVVGEGSMQVVLTIQETDGHGVAATIMGGDLPHVGGVAVAVPRPCSNADRLTCDVSQICLPGHKDVYAAVEVAKLLALGTGEAASVTAGIHVDGATQEDIAELLKEVRAAASQWIEERA